MLIANYLPDTNYTRDLSQGFNTILKRNDRVFLCGRKNEHVTDGKVPVVDNVWKKGILFFIPIISYILKNKADVVHIQQEFKMYGGIPSAILFPWVVLFIRLLGKTVVVTPHGVVSTNQLNENFLQSFGLQNTWIHNLLIRIFLNYSYKLIVGFASCTTVHTGLLKKILIDEYKCKPNKVVIIEHGIREIPDRAVIPLNPYIVQKFPMLKNKQIILVFGYFSPRKGFEYLIESFKNILAEGKIHGWTMVLAGDVAKEFVSYREKIDKLIKKLHLEKSILITGFVDAKEIDELYRISKISVIPAIFSFNTSGALAMTLAYGKPLLVANVQPLSEEIKENNFGLLYDRSGPNSFKQQLTKIITNEKLYKSLEQSVRKSSTKRFWKHIAQEHYSFYKKLVK